MLTNKNLKYLFYRYNNLRLQETCQNSKERLVLFYQKAIAVTKGLNKIDLSENETKIVKEITKNYKTCRQV